MGILVSILVVLGVAVICHRILANRQHAGANRQLARLAFEPDAKLRMLLAEATGRIRQLWRWSERAIRQDHLPLVLAAYANLRGRLMDELELRKQARKRHRDIKQPPWRRTSRRPHTNTAG